MTNIIAKIGGKILEDSRSLESTISQFKTLVFEKKLLNNIIIVSGGGIYANFVRLLDKELTLGNEKAHWMAIKAMEFLGLKSMREYSEIECIKSFDDLLKSQKGKGITLFLPFEFLFKSNELPHSWDVTSDAITLYLAYKLGLKDCYLIKDVEGIIDKQNRVIKEITVDEYKHMKKTNKLLNIQNENNKFKKSQPLDEYSLELIEKFRISIVILNGKSEKQSIFEFFNKSEDNRTVFTKIKPN